jgi:predicted RecA/RadA family phage recombinase
MLQLRSPSDQIKQAAFAATGATTAKTPFVQNAKAFIPVNSADAAAASNHVYESEVSDAPKATGEAWAVGAVIYWDDTNKKFTTTATSNTKCGYALAPALAADTVSPLFKFDSFA